jgi:UDP-N-acetylenolpyruvoylglucosamine reductase
MNDTIFHKLQEELQIPVKQNEALAQHTTMKVGGAAEYFVIVYSVDHLVQTVLLARKLNIPYFIIGGGSNIIVTDQGIPGIVIKNNSHNINLKGVKGIYNKGYPRGDVFIEVDSGTSMNQLVRYTVEAGFSGIEMHLGLPGSVGGAIRMNSKWMHPESYVGEKIKQVTLLTSNNDIKIVPKSYFKFGYDYSILQETNEIVLRAVFELKQSNKDLLWKVAQDSIEYRKKTQPQGLFTS